MDVVRVDTLITGSTEHQVIDNLRENRESFTSSSRPTDAPPLLSYVHAEHGLAVALQRSQQEAVLGISHADGAVVGAHQQDPPGALLRGGQAADGPRPMALKHLHLPVCLENHTSRQTRWVAHTFKV